jgi:pimeloyl-ACP methyl ester carboxylesterase
MSGTWRLAGHLSLAVLALTTLAQRPAAAQADPSTGSATFVVMLGGSRIGTERATLIRTAGGWVLSATGQLAAPFNLQTNKLEIRYGFDWQPRQLTIDAQVGGQPLTLSTAFGLTTATSDMVQAGRRQSATRDVSPRTVVLPPNFFAAYEGLAPRLAGMEAGGQLPVFLAPTVEVTATLDRVTPRYITAAGGDLDIREYDLTLSTPNGPLAVQIWVDAGGRLARMLMPATGLAAIRDDLSSVMAREEKVRNPGDEDVFVPANGFNIAATITKPSGTSPAAPVVVLISAAGPEDRDYALSGIPVFGRLAGTLADAGFFVVRYDSRGVGQSGGRPENAGIREYAEDARRVVRWVRRRDDVDRDRIAVIAHGQGAAVALALADMEGDVRAVAMLAATAQTGYEATLAAQARTLAAAGLSPTDQQERMALQRRLLDAVATGRGWDAVPEDLRKQADTAWFRSWLQFDPARAIDRIDQPILIVHGALDAEVPPANADRLEALARERDDRRATTTKTIVPDVNHLMVRAETGAPDEYASLTAQGPAPAVVSAIVDWLRTALPN